VKSWSGRRLVVVGLVSLIAAILAGGGALAVTERAAFSDGLWWSFSVVSTTGFEGPTGVGGRIISMVLFGWAVMSYLALVAGVCRDAIAQLDARSSRRRETVLAERDVRRIVESVRFN
jgi:hypothetical protein